MYLRVTTVLPGTIENVIEKVFPLFAPLWKSGQATGGRRTMGGFAMCQSRKREPLIELQASTGKWIMNKFAGRLNFYVAAGLTSQFAQVLQCPGGRRWGTAAGPMRAPTLCEFRANLGKSSLIPFRYDWLGIMRQFWVFSACAGVVVEHDRSYFRGHFLFFGAWASTQLTQSGVSV